MKTKITLFLILIAILAGVLLFQDKTPYLKLNNDKISLIIADTEEERDKGLGDRESMPDNTAMLFVFDVSDTYAFWMKDMKFPIDIVWLDENKRVVHIVESAMPESYPENFIPPDNSLYVIELNAGLVSKYGIKVGNILNFKF